jgi:hypothetical protein
MAVDGGGGLGRIVSEDGMGREVIGRPNDGSGKRFLHTH